MPSFALAGPPTVTVETDMGSREAAPFASCVTTRPAPEASPPGGPSVACADGPPGSSPQLSLTPGSVVTLRASQPLLPGVLDLSDERNRSIPGLPSVTTEAAPDGSVRFTLPASAPALTFAFLSLRWEDAVFIGDTTYGFGLAGYLPPTKPNPLLPIATPAPTPAPTVAPAPGRLRLIALERVPQGAALTLEAPVAGQLRLSWRSGDRRRSKSVTVPAGRRVVRFALPRTVRRVHLRARLLAAGESRRTARSLRVTPATR